MICPTPPTTFSHSALPVDRGDMRETVLPDGRRRLVYDYRGPDGPAHVQTTLPAGTTIAERIKAKSALVEKAERRSLKDQEARFEDMVDAVLKRNNGAGMQWVYDRIKKDLAGPINNGFAHRYNRYLDTLLAEEKSVNTMSNHKSAIRRVLNFAYKRHSIESMPIRDFEIKSKFRSRVLSRDERNRLEDAMRGMKDGRRQPGVPVSYMYWSIRFAKPAYGQLYRRFESFPLRFFAEFAGYTKQGEHKPAKTSQKM